MSATTNTYKRRALNPAIPGEAKKLAKVFFSAANTPSVTPSDLIEVIDDYTGEEVVYAKTGVWLDGSAMRDEKLFVGMYYKLNGFYYKRLINGLAWIAEWFGISVNNNDNAPLIQALHDYLPVGSRQQIVFSVSNTHSNTMYRCSATLSFTKPISLIGNKTSIGFVTGIDGIVWVCGELYPKIEGFTIQGYGVNNRNKTDGKIGLKMYSVAIVTNVTVSNFSGYGVEIYGAIGPGSQINASLGIWTNLSVASNGLSGMHITGPDASRNLFIQLDARDNNDFGVLDNAFLGNMYINPHFNNNGAPTADGGQKPPINGVPQSGPMFIKNVNARTNIIGYYAEDGQNPSVSWSNKVMVDGVMGDGAFNGAIVRDGAYTSYAEFNRGRISNSECIGLGNAEMFWKTKGNDAVPINFRPVEEPYSITNYGVSAGNGDAEKNFMQYFTGGSQLLKGSGKYNRSSSFASVAFRTYYLGGLLRQVRPDTNVRADWPYNQDYKQGDELTNPKYNGANPKTWTCIRNGSFGNYTEGLTATSYGHYIRLSGISTVLYPGATFKANGVVFTITGKSPSNATDWFIEPTLPGGAIPAGSTLQFEVPVWKADGSGAGLLAQRPSLTVDDVGWRYFATNTNTWTTWNGEIWV